MAFLFLVTSLQQHCPNLPFMQDGLAVMVRSLAASAHTLRGVDFANLFHMLGTFGVHPGPNLLRSLLAAAEPRIIAMQPWELCNMYWGLGLIVSVMCSMYRALGFTVSLICSIYWGLGLIVSVHLQHVRGPGPGGVSAAVCTIR